MAKTKVIRGGSGIGDSLYVRGVVEWLLQNKKGSYTVRTDYPDLFRGLDVEFTPFGRQNVDILAHYSKRKAQHTNQWEDVCIESGIPYHPLSFSWKTKKYFDEPYVLIASPRIPMGRNDGFGEEILPDMEVFQDTVKKIKLKRILIGEKPLFPIECDLDLTGKTSLHDLMDLGNGASGLVGQCSFIIPLGEGFDKPVLVVWSHRVFNSDHYYVQRINPRKILSGRKSTYLYDDWDEPKREEVIQAFNKATSQEEV